MQIDKGRRQFYNINHLANTYMYREQKHSLASTTSNTTKAMTPIDMSLYICIPVAPIIITHFCFVCDILSVCMPQTILPS